MGRLEIEIRHGHSHGGGPAQWGAVIALIVLVLFAAAGHKEISAMLHDVVMVVEITALSLAGTGVLALAVYIAVRVRAARRERARYACARPVTVRPDSIRVTGPDAAPALDAARRRPAAWPLPGQWEQVTPPPDGDGRRYS
jgi:hypothetical protein